MWSAHTRVIYDHTPIYTHPCIGEWRRLGVQRSTLVAGRKFERALIKQRLILESLQFVCEIDFPSIRYAATNQQMSGTLLRVITAKIMNCYKLS
jgi:hypothetical protein